MDKPGVKVSLKMIIKTIAQNDQLLWISLIFLIQQVGNGIVLGGVGSTYIYFEFGYNGGLYSIFTTVGMSATAFLMIFYPMITKRIERKRLMGILQLVSLFGFSIMFLAGIILPSSMGKFYIITIGYLFANIGMYGFYLIMMISIINTVEYNEYKHGVRNEAIITSLRPFLSKLSSAIVVAITSGSYLLFSVTGFTNKISDLESQAARTLISESEKLSLIQEVLRGVSSCQTTGLLFAFTLLPLALMLISYLLYKKKYSLDESEYNRIYMELEKRRGNA